MHIVLCSLYAVLFTSVCIVCEASGPWLLGDCSSMWLHSSQDCASLLAPPQPHQSSGMGLDTLPCFESTVEASFHLALRDGVGHLACFESTVEDELPFSLLWLLEFPFGVFVHFLLSVCFTLFICKAPLTFRQVMLCWCRGYLRSTWWEQSWCPSLQKTPNPN